MTLDEIIAARQSCRSYDPSRPVSKEALSALIESARLAPSACNSQTWRFVVVTDRTMLDTIHAEGMRMGVGNNFLKEAPALIIGCSKLDLLANTVGRTISGIDYYQVDLGIAMEHMVLKATELGLGTCWIGWFHEKSIKKLLGIPRGVKITALLSVGYPKQGDPLREKKRKATEEIAMWEKW
ncbi:MAG: nitroreductase family protein [Fibrobacteres bacterium]|nr:nitroreductase family protein [Fibrobacterota bacterium]